MSQINFPNSPSDGDQFVAGNGTTYEYDAGTGQWKILEGPGALGPSGPIGATGATSVVPGPTGATGSSGIDSVRMTGEITMWGSSSVPSGWLECNGQSTSGYTALETLIGSNVPDLRGEFVRGWDNGRGVDTGRSLGSTQGQDIQAHTHTFKIINAPVTGSSTGTGGSQFKDQNTGSTGGTETRPRNVSLMYIIKT